MNYYVNLVLFKKTSSLNNIFFAFILPKILKLYLKRYAQFFFERHVMVNSFKKCF